MEEREATTTTRPNGYLAGWPGVAQAFRLTRERAAGGKVTAEVVYGITSLSRSEAGGARLRELCRADWGVENGPRDTRAETLREGRCRVRRGDAPRALATLGTWPGTC